MACMLASPSFFLSCLLLLRNQFSSFRMFDKTLRSVQSFSQRDSYSHSSRPGCSNSPPPQDVSEGKPKKGFNSEHGGRYHGQHRKSYDRKPRDFSQRRCSYMVDLKDLFPEDFNQQQEERKKIVRPVDREEIASAFSYSDRQNAPKTRRGAINYQ